MNGNKHFLLLKVIFEALYLLKLDPNFKPTYFHSINPGFDAEVAEKFLNGIYCVCTANGFETDLLCTYIQKNPHGNICAQKSYTFKL